MQIYKLIKLSIKRIESFKWMIKGSNYQQVKEIYQLIVKHYCQHCHQHLYWWTSFFFSRLISCQSTYSVIQGVFQKITQNYCNSPNPFLLFYHLEVRQPPSDRHFFFYYPEYESYILIHSTAEPAYKRLLEKTKFCLLQEA